MDTQNGREGQPSQTHPDEINVKHPAKEIAAQNKVTIKESGLGREQGQTPADEHIEVSPPNNDDDDINDTDDRDQGDSTRDWDAEHSRTGRNK
ncbi:hypothetical protein HYN48_10860 [Flavobacterium magnum]|uniref:Uncharacterized protein n=1 Tax=Flavobacterium magnum TaxID=2162713 RepID=A0A2S0RG91_9FLAO|nr:hypothetical protein [Flavobacterium magnum]AWA30549.1 hypothetical protein HYN48_10860 [Flavobacterium magnum]